jgi:hypothetical protein
MQSLHPKLWLGNRNAISARPLQTYELWLICDVDMVVGWQWLAACQVRLAVKVHCQSRSVLTTKCSMQFMYT